MTPRSLMAFCREKSVKSVRIRYTALSGAAQHCQIPLESLTEQLFETGMPLVCVDRDSSSADECLLVPIAETAYLSPNESSATLVLLGEMQDAITRREDDFDSRCILQRAQDAWKNAGFSETIMVGQTCEVVLLRDFQHRPDARLWRQNEGDDETDSKYTKNFLSGRIAGPSPYGVLDVGGSQTGSLATTAEISTLCSQCVLQLGEVGIAVAQGSYSATEPGLCRFRLLPTTAVRAADNHLLACEIIRSAAEQSGLFASFLPFSGNAHSKPAWHLRLTAWKDQEPQMLGTGLYGLSEKAMSMAAGIMAHLPSCTAFCNPSENSFRRLNQSHRGYGRIVTGSMSNHNVVRVVTHDNTPGQKCLELTFTDQTCNPYLAIASILMAAVDGLEENYTLDELGKCASLNESRKPPRHLPLTLDRAIAALQRDHTFLLSHDVFERAVVKQWIRFVRRTRVDAFSEIPNSNEFRSQYR